MAQAVAVAERLLLVVMLAVMVGLQVLVEPVHSGLMAHTTQVAVAVELITLIQLLAVLEALVAEATAVLELVALAQ